MAAIPLSTCAIKRSKGKASTSQSRRQIHADALRVGSLTQIAAPSTPQYENLKSLSKSTKKDVVKQAVLLYT